MHHASTIRGNLHDSIIEQALEMLGSEAKRNLMIAAPLSSNALCNILYKNVENIVIGARTNNSLSDSRDASFLIAV